MSSCTSTKQCQPQIVRFCAAVLLIPGFALAQQPFYTDDADVTARGKFHFEFSNQYSVLQRSAFPNLRQNAGVFQLNYGVLEGLEIGVDSPLLTVFNARGTSPLTAVGNGDTNLTLKWNFHRENGRAPALTVSCAVEAPTGNTARQLGSGVMDIGFNTIAEKHLGEKNVLRVNNGLILSGNTLTGVVGLKAQGLVYSSGASITRVLTHRLLLGMEINGAVAQTSDLGKAALQTQAGGKYTLRENLTLDFGLLVGRFAGSPRLGLQVGFSKDF